MDFNKKPIFADEYLTVNKRLRLRPIQESDAKLYFKWYNDSDVGKYLNIPNYSSIADAKQGINIILNLAHKTYLIIFYTGTPVGHISIERSKEELQTAVLGIMIGEKSYWNKGIATDMVIWIEAIAPKLNFNTIKCKVSTDNLASQKVLEKLRFTYKETINGEMCFIKDL